ncbi:MAG: hypothetical protein GY771_00655 [bacterium]|nr:hypothetical protein [bacterium]
MIIDYKFVVAINRNLFPRVLGYCVVLQAALVIGFFFMDGSVGWWTIPYAAVSGAVAYIILVTFPEFFMVEGGRVFIRQFWKKREIEPENVPEVVTFKVVRIGGKQVYGHRFKSSDEYFEVIYLGGEKSSIIDELRTGLK